jgi:hypothetical protein
MPHPSCQPKHLRHLYIRTQNLLLLHVCASNIRSLLRYGNVEWAGKRLHTSALVQECMLQDLSAFAVQISQPARFLCPTDKAGDTLHSVILVQPTPTHATTNKNCGPCIKP